MLLLFAEQQSENTLEVQGMVFDKFFHMPRQAGNHLYRTSLLGKAIDQIPEEGVNIRPEGHLLNEMNKRGYPWKKLHYVVGLHDFEQYYADIYRKAMVHSRKHLKYSGRYLPLWKKNMTEDRDFEVAMAAFAEGLVGDDDLYIDKNQQLYQTKFEELNVSEKTTVENLEITIETVEEWLKKTMGKGYSVLNIGRYHPNPIRRFISRVRGNDPEAGLFESITRRAEVKMKGLGKRVDSSSDTNR